MANDTATVTQAVNSVTVEQPPQSSITVTETSGGALTLSETTGTLTAVTVAPLSSTLTIESEFAALNSPNFTGTPTAPTASPGTNTTQIATTSFVNSAVSLENSLSEMEDVTFASLGDNELLQYDSSSSKWKNQTIAEIGLATTSSLTAHTSATNNPHSVTATQVNLGNVTNESKTTMFSSPTFTGTPLAPTASAATNNTQLATTQYVTTAITNLIDSSPATLNTLNELAAALNDDANFAGTITSSIATKLPLAGGTMTGNIVMAGSQTVDGRDLSVDGAKLDGIDAGAKDDQTAAEIRALVDSASDSNVFTDADHTKLDGIAASANNYVHPTSGTGVSPTLSGANVLATLTSDSLGHVTAATARTLTLANLGYTGETDATADQTASEILTLIKTVDGASSGLDADLLDGSHASTFAAASDLSTHVGATNPHNITASTVSLGNVTNESKATMFTSAALTGTPTAPTANAGTDTTQIATTAFVNAAVALENTLAEMDDVVISSLANGELLQYNSGLARWINATPTEAGILPLAGGTMTGNLKLNDTKVLQLGSDADLQIKHDGSASYINQTGTGALHIRQTIADQSIFLSADNGSGTATTYIQLNGSTEDIRVQKDILMSTGKSLYMSGTNGLRFLHDGTNGLFINGTGDFIVSNGATDKDIKFKGNDGGSTITALTLDMSAGGNATFAGTVTAPSFHQDAQVASSFYQATFDSDVTVASSLILHQAGNFNYISSQDASKDLIIRNTGSGKDMVLQVTSSSGTAELLRLRGVTSKEIVASGNFEVRNGTNSRHINLYETYTDSSNYERSFFKHASSFLEIGTEALGTGTASGLKLKTGGSDRVTVLSDGKVGIGTTSPDVLLTVKKNDTTGPTIGLHNSEYQAWINSWGSTASSGRQSRFEINASTTDFAVAGDTIRFQIGNAGDSYEKMRIDSDGKVGIGIAAPTARLHVFDTGNSEIEVQRSSGALINIQAQAAKGVFGTDSNHPVAFKTNAGERVHITTAGSVGIGTAGPQSMLHVSGGDIRIDNNRRYQTETAGGGVIDAVKMDGSDNLLIGDGNLKIDVTGTTARLIIDSSGNTTLAGDLTVQGDISSTGTFTIIDTDVSTTEQLLVTNDGTGPAVIVNQKGVQPVIDFQDDGTSVFYIKNGGNVGIGTTTPEAKLDIKTASSAWNYGSGFSDSAVRITGEADGTNQGGLGLSYTDSGGGIICPIKHGNDYRRMTISCKDFRVEYGSATPRFFIDSAGKVGIGTTSPSSLLNLSDASNNLSHQIGFSYVSGGTETDAFTIGRNNSTGNLEFHSDINNHGFEFKHNAAGTQEFNILNMNVGIGTDAPSQKLEITAGNIQLDSAYAIQWGGTANRIWGSHSNNYIKIETNSTERLRVIANGSVGIGIDAPETLLHVKAADTVTGVIKVEGGKNTVSAVGEINSEIQFGSNDPSVGGSNIGGKISSVTEHSNGAWVGLGFYTYHQTVSDLAEHMRLTHHGRLGLGTTAPSHPFHLIAADGDISGDWACRLTNSEATAGQNFGVKIDGGSNASDVALEVSSLAGTQLFEVRGDGNVGIGITDPDQKLDVNGNIRIPNQGKIVFGSAGTASDYLQLYDVGTSGDLLKLVQDGNTRFTITGVSGDVYMQGDVGIGTTSPSAKLHVTGTGKITGHTDLQSTVDISDTTRVYTKLSVGNSAWITPSQVLEVGTNTDVSAQIGRAHVGYMGFADHAGFAHLDNATTSNYSLLQSNAGDTFINSAASRHIYFRKGNATIGGFNSSSDFYVDTDTLYVDASQDKVGIGLTSPAEELDVRGGARVGYSSTNGHLIGSKAYTITHNFTTGLTVSLAHHTACHVKVFITGDWANHSSLAYVGEFIIQNAADGYNEPGIILSQQDNLASDSIAAKIVDPSTGSGSPNDFTIQFQAVSDTSESISGRLCYHIMGDALSVT